LAPEPVKASLPEVSPQDEAEPVELSIVMPCLNEADTLAVCIEKAQRALREHGIAAEIIVADYGSTDGSREIGAGMGARVVEIPARGYGSALMGGIAAARGKYILGYQSLLFAVFTKIFAISEGLLPEDRRMTRLL